MKTGKLSAILIAFLLAGCICCVPAAAAVTASYVGIDKIDLQWYQYWGEDFNRYEIYQDDTEIDTIYEQDEVRKRVDFLNTDTVYDFEVKTIAGGKTFDTQSAYLTTGEVGGRLLIDGDTWSDASVTLYNDVHLGDFNLVIRRCELTTDGSDHQIQSSADNQGELELTDTSLNRVGVLVHGSSNTISDSTSNRDIEIRGNNTVITNVTVKGISDAKNLYQLKTYGGNNTLQNCGGYLYVSGILNTIEKCHLNSLNVVGNSNSIIDNIITDSPGPAISVQDCAYTMINNNTIVNATNYAKSYSETWWGNGIKITEPGSDVEIINNNISDTDNYAIYTYSPYDEEDNKLTYFGNSIEHSGKAGLRVENWLNSSEISENTFDSILDGAAISIKRGHNVSVLNNTITDSATGIYGAFLDSTISDNILMNSENYGISVSGQSGQGNNTISKNTISNPDLDYGDGIEANAPGSTITENNISAVHYGILCDSGHNVTNNTIADIEESAIYFHGVTEPSYIGSNVITNGMTSSYDDGGVIYLGYSGNITVENNTIEKGHRGIEVEMGGTGIIITNNRFYNQTHQGIQVYGALNAQPPSYTRGYVGANISANVFNGPSSIGGIHISNADGVTVTGNTIGNISTAIYVTYGNNTIISENAMTGLHGFGIQVGTGTIQSGVNISHNTIETTGQGGITFNGVNTTILENTISGYWGQGGIVIRNAEDNLIKKNNLTRDTTNIQSWDIVVDMADEDWLDSLIFEENTMGANHPTTFSVSNSSGSYWIRSVEDPPEPPTYPDYNTTQQAIGRWAEIIKPYGVENATMDLSFFYDPENIGSVEEATLSVWKYNGTYWDAGGMSEDTWNGSRWNGSISGSVHYVGVGVEKFCIFAPLGGKPVHNFRTHKDFDTITEAVDDSETADGDTIYVDPGYANSGVKENIGIAKQLTIKSSSGKAADVAVCADETDKPVFTVYSDEVLIDGFVISGATESVGVLLYECENSDVKNCKLTGNNVGVQIKNFEGPSTFCTIADTSFEGNSVAGLVMNKSKENNIFDCSFTDPYGILLVESTGNSLQDNLFTDCSVRAITLEDSDSNEIKYCNSTNVPLGILLSESDNNTVSDTTIQGSSGAGIELQSSDKNTVSKVTFTSCITGLFLTDAEENTISECTVTGPASAGVTGLRLFNSDTNSVEDCLITNVSAPNFRITGIELLSGASFNTIRDIIIADLKASLVRGVAVSSSLNEFHNISISALEGKNSGVTGFVIDTGVSGTWLEKGEIAGLTSTGTTTGLALRDTSGGTIRKVTVSGLSSTTNATEALNITNADASDTFNVLTIGDTYPTTCNLTVSGNLTVSPVKVPPADPAEAMNISHYLNLSAAGPTEVSLSVTFTEADLDGKEARFLRMWTYHDTWSKLAQPNGVNETGWYVYAENITDFSIFAPMWSDAGTPHANFTAAPLRGTAALNVVFDDTSTGDPDTWLWTFGDGNSSTKQNPSHTYTGIGNYTVTLNISNALGWDMEEKTDYIFVGSAPEANFSANVTTGEPPLGVLFTSSAKGIPKPGYSYDFGDKTNTTEENPVHTYEEEGFYNVSQTVTNEFGTDELELPAYIAVGYAPTVNFSANLTSGAVPFSVHFEANVSGTLPMNYSWNFGDGNVSSAESPIHTYTAAGTYNVSLTATNVFGSDSMNKTAYISAGNPPVAHFTATPSQGETPLAVGFKDSSTGTPIAWEWEFGDGAVTTEQNPSHIFTNPGAYEVNLTVSNAYGENLTGQIITVTDSTPPQFEITTATYFDISTINISAVASEALNASPVVTVIKNSTTPVPVTGLGWNPITRTYEGSFSVAGLSAGNHSYAITITGTDQYNNTGTGEASSEVSIRAIPADTPTNIYEKGSTSVNIVLNTSTTNASVSVTEYAAPEDLPADNVSIAALSIDVDNATRDLLENITIRIPFTPADVEGTTGDLSAVLKIYFYDTTLSQWIVLDSTVHGDRTSGGYVEAVIDHLTVFSLMTAQGPFSLSNVTAVPGNNSAVITWTTNKAATSKISWGLSAAYSASTADGTQKTSHSKTLTNLTASTTYHYNVESYNASAATTINSTDQTFTTTADPTPTSTPTAAPTSSGGGGSGGGGGGSWFTSPQYQRTLNTVTGVAFLDTDTGGVIQSGIIVEDTTGAAALVIESGIQALSYDGTPLPDVTISAVSTGDLASPSAGMVMVGDHVYECRPNGAQFSPPIEIVFRLTEEEFLALPAGEVFSVQYYDTVTGTWVPVETVVDAVNREVSGRVDHFTAYALMMAAADTGVPSVAKPVTTPVQGTETGTTASPGFGVLMGILALGGVAVLLRRR